MRWARKRKQRAEISLLFGRFPFVFSPRCGGFRLLTGRGNTFIFLVFSSFPFSRPKKGPAGQAGRRDNQGNFLRSTTLANHKSALKRDRQSQQRRLRNRNTRTQVKNVVRRINEAVAAQSVEGAQEALRSAIPVIDRAAVKGAIHKKNASRKVSRLTRKVNVLREATTQAAS